MIKDDVSALSWLADSGYCDEAARARLEQLAPLLADENTRQNLVSRSSLDEVWRRHIADSAQLLLYVPRGTGDWLDLGTGAGFPGLVIAILQPERKVLLVESRARRIAWLERAAVSLGLDNVQVIGKRLELVETRQVDVISARAFAPLVRLLDLSSRFSTDSTTWVLPKGRSAQQELDELRGWRHTFHVEQSLTEPQAGVIVGTLSGRKGNKL